MSNLNLKPADRLAALAEATGRQQAKADEAARERAAVDAKAPEPVVIIQPPRVAE